MLSVTSGALSSAGSYLGSHLATPSEMIGNLNTVSKLAVPIILFVATQQAVEALPGACITCVLACSAMTGGAFTPACWAACVGLCPWVPF